MKNDINLLPKDLKANKDIVKLSTLLARLAVVVGLVLLLGSAIGGGYLLFLQNQVQQSETVRNNIKAQIQGLETTEQKFILVKDRVLKSQNILSQRGKFKEFKNYLEFVKLLPENVSFAEEELDASISRITLNVPSSADLSFVLDLIESDQKYVQAKIENLNFDILKGYKLTLNLF